MKIGSVLSIVAVLSLTIVMPFTSFGHHSFAGQFDPSRTIEIEGEIVAIRWINPHASLTIEVSQNGETIEWDLETAGAIQLSRSGVQRDFFKVGDRVRVAGWPPVTDAREIHATNMLLPDGRELILARNGIARFADQTENDYAYARQREGDTSRPELGLFRVWSSTGASPFLFPQDINANFDLERYPITDAARVVIEGFDRARDNPTLNCTPKGMPTIMEQPYRTGFSEDGDNILVQIEEYDLLRTVHMDRESAPAGEPSTPLGYSTGRWEDTTLVVTTSHLSWPWFDQAGIPQSGQSVLVERFSPTPDGSRLDYSITVTDPVNLSEAVTLERFWLDLGGDIVPYECMDEG